MSLYMLAKVFDEKIIGFKSMADGSLLELIYEWSQLHCVPKNMVYYSSLSQIAHGKKYSMEITGF